MRSTRSSWNWTFIYTEILRLYKKILTTANISNVTNLKILTDTDKYKKKLIGGIGGGSDGIGRDLRGYGYYISGESY